ncbi:MAG: hypothetical protein P1V20_03105 [Verrucomicrobiales bacterium]|nr:hypothetical protein [Verrucomicrobiales bacterium]
MESINNPGHPVDTWSAHFAKNCRQSSLNPPVGVAFPLAVVAFAGLVLGIKVPSFLAMGITIYAGLGGVSILLFSLRMHVSLLDAQFESDEDRLPVSDHIPAGKAHAKVPKSVPIKKSAKPAVLSKSLEMSRHAGEL